MARTPPAKRTTRTSASARRSRATAPETASGTAPAAFVGIGASAGGLEAFTQFLQALPADSGAGFVLVPHLAPGHASMLSEILSRTSAIPVVQVTDGMPVEPNRAHVIPPGADLDIRDGRLQLLPRAESVAPHRSIDAFFRSLAADQGHRSIGVVLSGTANDGTVGLEEIKAAGGLTFSQDDTAQQTSMPRSAVAAGAVDFVLPPGDIAREIARVVRHPFVWSGTMDAETMHQADLGRVGDALHQVTGVDFRQYKRNTLMRRVTRRIVVHKLPGLKDYIRLLEKDRGEVEALFQDVLISVTSFFRNAEALDILKDKVFPRIVGKRSRLDPVRVWVQGCSTGEEAYSIAIALTEYLESTSRPVQFQIFATDVNAAVVEKARAGVYARSIAHDVSPERLRRFFAETEGGYRIAKTIRDRCVFAQHNVLSDPPFSHIDLVSCRNLLIYLDAAAQQRLIPIMHYALKPSGFLWLGSSETIGAYRDLFEIEDARAKIYSRKPGHESPRLPLPLGPRVQPASVPRPVRGTRPSPAPPAARSEPFREADGILLARYGPAAVLVSGELDVLQFRGDTGMFLAPSPGRASLNLLKLLREGLLVPVRGAISRARREGAPVRQEGVRVRTDGGYRTANLEVVPLPPGSQDVGSFLVVFEETGSPAAERARGSRARVKAAKRADVRELKGRAGEVRRVEQELAATRDYLQSVIEQQEAANEELQSANEEVQSANEELQSINEELETSKEEIQSSNEELATVNDELRQRNTELARSLNDFSNLLSSVLLPIVILDPELRIRRFTPGAETMLNLLPQDVGRPITDIKMNLTGPDLEPLLAEVIRSATPRELEVQDRQGRWFSMRLQPYRTMDGGIDGAVLVLVDIDALKRG